MKQNVDVEILALYLDWQSFMDDVGDFYQFVSRLTK